MHSAFQAPCLPVHVLHYNIMDFPQGRAVLQYFPWLVCMKMNLNQFLVSHCQQAVALKILSKIIADHIFVQILSLDQQLRVILILVNAF